LPAETNHETHFLVMELIEGDIGELVVDPFCGSGSSLVAAQFLRRRVAGCDVEAEYVTMTRKQLADHSIEIELPKCMRKAQQK